MTVSKKLPPTPPAHVPGQALELGARLSPSVAQPEDCDVCEEGGGGLETDATAAYWVAISAGESQLLDADGSAQTTGYTIGSNMSFALAKIFDYVSPDSTVTWILEINTSSFGPFSPDGKIGTGLGTVHFGHDYAVYGCKASTFTTGDVHTITPTVDGVELAGITLTV